jgi:hypothetical protein
MSIQIREEMNWEFVEEWGTCIISKNFLSN